MYKKVDANAPATDIHSFFERPSLKINAETRAEMTIAPPETIGYCTEAGTLLADIIRRKLPV